MPALDTSRQEDSRAGNGKNLAQTNSRSRFPRSQTVAAVRAPAGISVKLSFGPKQKGSQENAFDVPLRRQRGGKPSKPTNSLPTPAHTRACTKRRPPPADKPKPRRIGRAYSRPTPPPRPASLIAAHRRADLPRAPRPRSQPPLCGYAARRAGPAERADSVALHAHGVLLCKTALRAALAPRWARHDAQERDGVARALAGWRRMVSGADRRPRVLLVRLGRAGVWVNPLRDPPQLSGRLDSQPGGASRRTGHRYQHGNRGNF